MPITSHYDFDFKRKPAQKISEFSDSNQDQSSYLTGDKVINDDWYMPTFKGIGRFKIKPVEIRVDK